MSPSSVGFNFFSSETKIFIPFLLLENMHYFISETAKMEVGSVGSFTKKARILYDENLTAYVKIMFRRPFGKIVVSHPPVPLAF